MNDRPAPLIHFLESHLGTMSDGVLFDAPKNQPVQVARFDNQPIRGATTLVTTGLSKHVLHQVSGSDIRVELLACAYSRFAIEELPPLLFAMGQEILEKHHAPAHGDVVGPRGRICDGSALEAFYFSHPAYHSKSLSTFDGEPPITVLAWAVPISVAEAAYVRQRGWSSFEKLLVKLDPDLMDLGRASIV